MTIIDDIFGESGPMAANVPGYVPRPGQIAISNAIYEGMSNDRHVLAEGPCGLGKSYSYIIPAVLKAKAKGTAVVIATANIALQEQLIRKDLPALAHALGKDHEFTYALLKGVNNYLCLNAFNSAGSMLSQRSMFQSPETFGQFSNTMAWAEETKTGDVSELDFIPMAAVWSKLSTTADDCLKRECPQYEACFAMKARRAAREVDVIVTNYHMLFAHLAVVASGGEGILPAFDVLVCDEAHEAADIAREFFGISVSQGGVNALASMAASEVKSCSHVAQDLKTESDIFFNYLTDYARSKAYKIRLRKPEFVNDSSIVGKLEAIADKVGDAEEAEHDKAKKTKLGNIRARAANAAKNIRECVRQENPDSVYWIEVSDKGGSKLRSKPVYVHDILKQHLFDAIPSVTCISATLTTGDADSPSAFEFIRKELGCPEDCIRVVGPSPFDFSKQALVVVPSGLPSPKDSGFAASVALAVEKAVSLCGGSVLGLFTSYKNLNLVYEHIARTAGVRVLKQGDMPRPELTRIFKEDKASVLLGTDSFWTGVDVPGDACVCVVIDRIPFGHPEDPVVDAISERDKAAFTNYHIPRAVIDFRQGVGRLIRTHTDVGAVVILDNRVISTPWGNRYFWASMPRGIHARQDMNMIPGFIAWAKTQVLTPST